MTDELLPYYHRELAYIRQLGAEFAQAHPKIAGRLRWAGDGTEDPHVSRLIEASAFLAARVRRKLDDEFPELSSSLLDVLYPHYLAPTPSTAIVQLQIDRSQGKLVAGYRIPSGSSVETESIEGQPCRFRTVYDVELWPIEITQVQYQGLPFPAPPTIVPPGSEAMIRVKLKTLSPEVKMNQLAVRDLRFHLHGRGQFIHDLYELLLNNVLAVGMASSVADSQATRWEGVPRPVGFEVHEGVYDYSPRSFPGYRLLTEYFTCPEKFFFFDLPSIDSATWTRVGHQSELEIYFFLNRHQASMEHQVRRDSMRLGCTPIVNLYKQRCEPIRCRHTHFEYRIVPDARRPTAHEVFRVEKVMATSPTREEQEFLPFYSTHHAATGAAPRAFWHTSRRRADHAGGQIDRGTEVYLTLVDLDMQPAASLTDWVIDVDTICLNRSLPSRLEFGGGKPHLHLVGGGPLGKVECLTPPTPTYRPQLGPGVHWRLISHLALNHVSLLENARGAEALREILTLYDPLETQESRTLIEGLTDVRWRRVVGRVAGGAAAGFCRGLEVTLQFDEEKYSGSGIFLLSSVLERFLGLYASLNAFTQTVVTSRQRPGIIRRWPPRAGQQVLL